jgi:microcystin-dependent protein
MSNPYIGEIRLFAGNFAPAGWAFCAGQLLPISENDALFNLIGTTYGGDGQSTFALPDLRSRVPVHQGNGFVLAQSGGVEQVTLTVNQIASHGHAVLGTTSPATDPAPGGHVLAESPFTQLYQSGAAGAGMASDAVQSVGGNQPHDNMQPYLCLNFIISLFGIFPSQT